jgi:hypothetical protein
MDKIKLITHNSFSGVNDLKTSCLYFDHVEVANHFRPYVLGEPNAKPTKHKNGKFYIPGKVHIQEHFITEEFKEHIKPLITEGLVSLKYEPYMVEEKFSPTQMTVGDPSLKVSSFILSSYPKFFKSVTSENKKENGNDTISFSGELQDEVVYANREFWDKKEDLMLHVFKYYGHLLSSFLRNLDNGEKILTTSELLNDILVDYYNSDDFKETKRKLIKELEIHPSIAFNAINLALPDVSKLPMEEVLEIRLRLKDELLSFKNYTKSLQLEFEGGGLDHSYIHSKSNEIVIAKIKPALDDLTRKLNDIEISTVSTLLKEIKDPKSYSPLLLSVTNNISSTYAILISLGLISFTTAIDQYRANKEIKNNGLYYLLKLKNYA